MHTRREDLLALLMPVARRLRRIEEEAAARHGLTMWQYAILAVAESQPGLNQGDVAQVLDYSKNRIIADVDQLESAGLLIRQRAVDRRANLLTTTDTGRKAMIKVQTEIHRAEDELLAGVSPRGREALVRGLRQLSAQLRPRR